MKKIRLSIMSALLMAHVVTSLAAMAAQEPQGVLPGARTGERFEILLEPGEYYSKDVNYLVYRYTVWPQVAVWIETPEGDYIDTLYVTRVVVDQDFNAAPDEGRPEALPVWSHLTASDSAVDAVTSATTVDSDVYYGNNIAADLPDGKYVIKLETNRSYDWNSTYTKKNSGVNGQPSLLYYAEVEVGGEDVTVDLIPYAVGSVDGSDGNINTDLSGIDTAYELFNSLKIAYRSR